MYKFKIVYTIKNRVLNQEYSAEVIANNAMEALSQFRKTVTDSEIKSYELVEVIHL